jgi:hypothetical protein
VRRSLVIARQLGYKSPAVMEAGRRPDQKPLTIQQLRDSLDALEARDLIHRCQASPRNVYFSTWTTADELRAAVKAIVEKKSKVQELREIDRNSVGTIEEPQRNHLKWLEPEKEPLKHTEPLKNEEPKENHIGTTGGTKTGTTIGTAKTKAKDEVLKNGSQIPGQTPSNLVKPRQTPSNLVKPRQTPSNLVKPSSHLLKHFILHTSSLPGRTWSMSHRTPPQFPLMKSLGCADKESSRQMSCRHIESRIFMAKVLGDSARYTSQSAVHEDQRLMLHGFMVVAMASAVAGACFASFVPVGLLPAWLRIGTIPTATLAALWILGKWGFKRLRTLEKNRAAMRRGASGEIQVGCILSGFPDDFYVLNDLTTPFGNLDHVVIGPNGVFVLDTKNCRGLITPDGAGGLLLNGRRAERDYVRPLVARMLHVRDRVRVLAAGPDPFYHAVLVFTAAWVDARWGTTGRADCVRDDLLQDYILDRKTNKRLSGAEVKQIAQAFLSLARMDEGFSRTPEVPGLRMPVRASERESVGA